MANARAEAVAALVDRLGHRFADPALLERALTHSSVGEGADKAAGKPARHNERLEFLGDRVLGLLVADRLHSQFPDADEGELSSRLLRLSPGETKTGGRRKEGVVADGVEAILAAVWLDGGIEAARAVFERAWAEEMAAPAPRALNNPKSTLQEWSQGQGRPLPTYRVVGQTGSDHAPTFTVEVSIPGVEPLTAQGRSRQDAEKAAATALLKREGVI